MTPIQPTGWQHYLKWQANDIPQHLNHYFYMSWEDALWDLLLHFQIPPKSTISVPAFFCGDVVENMNAHGLQVRYYPVDRNFHTDPELFARVLKSDQPNIVVILHAVGMTNQLFTHSNKWLTALSPDTLLVEDSVHRVVNPQNIQLLTPRHVVMDSLRKVAPLPGCNLFTHTSQVMAQTSIMKTITYQLQLIGWWLVFQWCLQLSTISFSWWQAFWNRAAEHAMLRGYDVIGDSQLAGSGWWMFKQLSRHLDYDKIQRAKQTQVARYQKLLAPVWSSDKLFEITFSDEDASLLRGYPVGLTIKTANQVLKKLRENGLLVRFELNDSQWATRQKVIYLPLGPHLSLDQIEEVARLLILVIDPTPAR